MTPEELKALLAAAANADTAPEALTHISDKVTALMAEHDKLTAEKAEADKTIANLRDTNMRLFLRTTGTAPDESKEEQKKITDMDRKELTEYFRAALNKPGKEENGN